jgi:hypothetical protein
VRFLECEQSGGELEEGEVVLGLLRPADQERAVAVEPGVACLDDPAAGSPGWIGAFELELVTAPAKVERVPVGRNELADPRVGVAAVETEALWRLGRWLRPRDRDRAESGG